MPDHCKLVHVNHLGRHGSRHATKLKDAERLRFVLESAEEDLTLLGKQALEWVREYIRIEAEHLGK